MIMNNIRLPSGKQLETVRSVSKGLFVSGHRLEVSALIAQSASTLVYAAELASRLGLQSNVVRKDLLKLAEAGVLRALPRTGGNERAYFEKRESQYWHLALALYQECLDSVNESSLEEGP
jgi:predicted ArsR family transcriptional regulator